MVSAIHASARVFRVRTEFITMTCEMRVHVLCECGSGAWIAAIAPFPDLFFDERPLIGRSVGEAVAWLGRRYAGLRLLADILGSPDPCSDPCSPPPPRPSSKAPPAGAKARPRRRSPEGQDELPLAITPALPPRRSAGRSRQHPPAGQGAVIKPPVIKTG